MTSSGLTTSFELKCYDDEERCCVAPGVTTRYVSALQRQARDEMLCIDVTTSNGLRLPCADGVMCHGAARLREMRYGMYWIDGEDRNAVFWRRELTCDEMARTDGE